MNLVKRNAILEAEQFLMSMPEHVTFPLSHDFSQGVYDESNGVYARTIFIPKDHILTGKVHKTEHLCVMYGDIVVDSEHAGGRLAGYQVFRSLPGAKRIGRTFADTWFTTIHRVDKDDIQALEVDLVCDTIEEYEQFLIESQKKIEVNV